MEDGAMVCKNKGNIWTVAGYSDFVLDFEFKLDKKTDRGAACKLVISAAAIRAIDTATTS